MTFQIKTNLSSSFYTVKISGELRSGEAFEKSVELPKAVQDAYSFSKDHVVIFDLSELTFWSTKGIHAVVRPVSEINKKFSNRAGIIGPRDHVLFLQAKKVLEEVGTHLVPWKKDKKALLSFIEGN